MFDETKNKDQTGLADDIPKQADLKSKENSYHTQRPSTIHPHDLIKANEQLLLEINERKSIEEELKRSKQICETVLNAIPATISLIDTRDFTIIDANKAFLDDVGMQREDAIGKTCHKLTHRQAQPCDSPDHICPIQQMMKTGLPSTVEHRHYKKDGGMITLEISAFPIKGPDGEALQVVHVAQDITERKKTEELLKKAQENLEKRVTERTAELVAANEQLQQEINERVRAERDLRKSEERFRTVADFTYDWEIWRGLDGEFIYVSPSCERITGYQADEFTQDANLLLNIIHPDDRDDFRIHLRDIERSSDIFHIRFRIIRRDGQVRWISHYCQPVYGADGTRLGRRSSNRDISERKEAENEILKYQEQLRLLNSKVSLTEERERRQIALDLHDGIGQTLAICQISAQKLQQATDSKTVIKAADRIISFINTAIADTRSLTFNLSPPALYELGLEAALDELAEQIQNEYGPITSLKGDARPKSMSLNKRITLYRATRELMLNVVKHARAKQMEVSIREENGHLRIEVIDDGVGFDTAGINSRLLGSESFGLFSVRERIRALDGGVEIVSTPGFGTTVALTVPLKHEGDSESGKLEF
ncbi:MAG: PAS domain S-box protein [Deltaproteobacteria bacterium]|nr:PAS domain S-box protein [Deltaproteobacteria bacterium]